MHSIDWSDLQNFLAVAERGSLAAAARALGVEHTTVLRRMRAFERRLGVRLFERRRTGYAVTAGGEELLAAVREIHGRVLGVERRLAGRDLRLAGPLRITTTDTLATSIFMPHLASFHAAYADVELSLSISNSMLSLSRREADVAIRPAATSADTLVGRRVGRVAFAVYAAKRARQPSIGMESLSQQPWIGLHDTLADTGVGRWMRTELPGVRVALRTDSFVTIRSAAAAGMGLAVLPCYFGDTSPQLTRVTRLIDALATDVWLLTHEDLRRTARVRAFLRHMANAMQTERALIEGEAWPSVSAAAPAPAGA